MTPSPGDRARQLQLTLVTKNSRYFARLSKPGQGAPIRQRASVFTVDVLCSIRWIIRSEDGEAHTQENTKRKRNKEKLSEVKIYI